MNCSIELNKLIILITGLSSLSVLNLADNLLSTVPGKALSSLEHLTELYLSGNLLKTLPSSAFSHLQNLNSLDISSSLISAVDTHAFSGLRTLRKLKLADNDLEMVPADAFYILSNLRVLDIGRNPFQVIPRGAFSYLKKLKKIDLSGCGNLSRIMSGALASCLDLEHIVISQNRKLTEIQNFAFDAVPSIKTANFEYNQLSFLPKALLPWDLLKQLKLAGNPWSCSECDLLLFLSSVFSVKNSELFSNNGGRCASPSKLNHVTLVKAFDAASNEVSQCAEEANNVIIDLASGNQQSKEFESQSNSLAATVSSCVVTLVLIAVLTTVVIRLKPAIMKICGKEPIRQNEQHGVDIMTTAHDHDCAKDSNEEEYRESTRIHFAAASADSSMRSPAQPSLDEEHYYYVTTMNNRHVYAKGKHIPVTEL